MQPTIPKPCDCLDTPTNVGTTCECTLKSSQYAYYGELIECLNIESGDSFTVIVQKIEDYFCGLGFTQHFLDTIQENPSDFTDFITLVNSLVNCNTLTPCWPTTTTTTTAPPTTSTTTSTTSTTSTSSTTTTTTTAVPGCYTYHLEAELDNASWTALTCNEIPVGGVIVTPLDGITTPCIINNTLVTVGMLVTQNASCGTPYTTTTTTTAAPTTTTTSTSTSSTTTTTTTLVPGFCEDEITVFNQSGSATINNVYATAWTQSIVFPILSSTIDYGTHDATTNAINVSLTVGLPGCISLYIDCALVQSLPVGASGIYTFSAISIATDSIMTIIYKDGNC